MFESALFNDLPDVRAPEPVKVRRRPRVLAPQPIDVPLDMDHMQERAVAESMAIYKHVVRIRNRGHQVYRHGLTQHLVAGRILSNHQLREFSRKLVARVI